nr:unnamed protein product [Callosobruchus chinensis]
MISENNVLAKKTTSCITLPDDDDTGNRNGFEDQEGSGLVPMVTFFVHIRFVDDTYSAENEESTESEGNLLERRSKKHRKRIRNEKNWSVNKRKIARAKGIEYKTRKNKTVRARSLKSPCSCRKK